MRIYIAGKITGLVYEEALRAFTEAEDELRRCNVTPVNPMKENGLDDGGKPHEWIDYMERDIPRLLSCQAIYLLPNWKQSTGARVEKAIAEGLGMQILTHGFAGRRVLTDEWIDCQADGCSEKFIQTDKEAEVDLCPRCDAALMRAAA